MISPGIYEDLIRWGIDISIHTAPYYILTRIMSDKNNIFILIIYVIGLFILNEMLFRGIKRRTVWDHEDRIKEIIIVSLALLVVNIIIKIVSVIFSKIF